MKEPKCKICGGRHYAFQCWQKPNKPIKSSNKFGLYKTAKPTKTKKTNKLSSFTKYSRKSAIRRLDQLTSEYVRRKSSNRNGIATCYTCGVRKDWREMDCGHYIKRSRINTRWDLDNLRCQCKECNQILSGNYGIYHTKIKNELGEEKINDLFNKARSCHKITTPEIYDMIEEMKKKIKELE